MVAPARHKYWCEACDFVCKASPYGHPLCPHCSKPGAAVRMTAMGRIWKPGPKGSRMRHYPEGFRLYESGGRDTGGYMIWKARIVGAQGYHQQQAALPPRAWSQRRPGDGKLRRAA
jgi:hypothetical protein